MRVSINDRPIEIEGRSTTGHWEGDLITGSGNSYIATLVERKSRFTILAQLDGKDTDIVIAAIIREIAKVPMQIRKTIIWDRGMEMAKHKEFSEHTMMDVYFCDPLSPWQTGTNENINPFLRQYFPRKTPLGHFSQDDLNAFARELNDRPRKVLDYQSPFEVLLKSVAFIN